MERAPTMKKSSSLLDMRKRARTRRSLSGTCDSRWEEERAQGNLTRHLWPSVLGRSVGHSRTERGGKTCLIDLLTLEAKGGEYTGDVRLNGNPLTPELFTKHCATVPQVDRLWAF